MKSYVVVAALSAALGLGTIAPSLAATLSMNVTADNQFDVYVSSSDSILGTLVLSGNSWGTTYSASVPVNGGAQFIHVIAINWTSNTGWPEYGAGTASSPNPEGFIGTFVISGGIFANGASTLSTDTTNWAAAAATPAGDPPWTQTTLPVWAAPGGSPVSNGQNGVGPWGTLSSVSPTADWIWSNSTNYDYAEFSTGFVAAPEPSVWTMMGLGFAALGFAAVHRSRKQAISIEG
jgi:MSHA biogenesis protein MshQ